jgi:hypothetical protein
MRINSKIAIPLGGVLLTLVMGLGSVAVAYATTPVHQKVLAEFTQQPTQLATVWTTADPALAVPTGGPFCGPPPGCSGGAVEAGHFGLPAGTWQVTVQADARPDSDTPAAPIQTFPQFFVYTQPKNTDSTGDVLNVGSGGLDIGAGHDSYYNGTGIVTVTAATEVYLYAFGYDSDSGAGSYGMTTLTVTAVSVPAMVTPPAT